MISKDDNKPMTYIWELDELVCNQGMIVEIIEIKTKSTISSFEKAKEQVNRLKPGYRILIVKKHLTKRGSDEPL